MTDHVTMEDIERKARAFAEARARLAETVRDTEAAMAAVKIRRLPVIRRRLAEAAEAEAALLADVEAGRALFSKPKSRTLHDIRVGWAKAKGKVAFADAGAVVKSIRRHLADRFDELVKVKETPIKTALASLSVAELKKIGATVTDTADAPFVTPTDSAIDKIVDALLDAARDDAGDGEDGR